MSSPGLFLRRLIEEWKFQYGVFRSILDWTIIVYLLLPGLVIFGFIYRSWWVEQPVWIENTPVFLLFFFGYLATWSGNYRNFTREADKVFLVKHPSLFIGLKKITYSYTLLLQASGIGLITLLFLPFLIDTYELTVLQIFTFFLIFTALKWLIMALKLKLNKIDGKLAKGLSMFLIFVFGSWISQFLYLSWSTGEYMITVLALILFAGTAVALCVPQLTKTSTFEEDWLTDKIERNKYLNTIFMLSPTIEKMNVSVRRKPWFFKNSNRIFKNRTAANGFLEIFIKVFLRNSLYWSGFLQIVSVTVAALIAMPPLWIKGILLICYVLFLHSWLSMIWEKITVSHPITSKYRDTDAYFLARKKAIRFLLLIGILLTIVLGYSGILFIQSLPV